MNELTKYQLLLFIVIMFSVGKEVILIAATLSDEQSKSNTHTSINKIKCAYAYNETIVLVYVLFMNKLNK